MWPLAPTLILVLILVLILTIATLSFSSFLLILCFVCGRMFVSTCHDLANRKGDTLIQALLHTT